MDASALATGPTIDGEVRGDPAWSGVIPATGFWQIRPEAGQPATQKTEVYIGFTDTTLYVGVIAYDDDPESIIVTDSRRDSKLDQTDAFLFIVDGLLDRQNGFVFGTNPAGIEYDGQVIREAAGGRNNRTGEGFNLNWDGTWEVRSQTGRYGWSAEFAIPFRTLRYGSSGKQDWGINFQRNIRRNNEVAFWAPLERNNNLYRVSKAGTLRGVTPSAQRNLQFIPYVLGGARDGSAIDGTASDTEFGFDLKYSLSPSLTLDATYNTDFAQVEVDEQQINLDRFNLFFPEKRPFFLENAGLFSVGNSQEVELFFSRRIGIGPADQLLPVDGGLRLSGKLGTRTNVGLLYMETEAQQDIAPGHKFSVARISRELPNRSYLGAIVTNREGGDLPHTSTNDDHYNRSYAVDGAWGIGEHLLLSGWLAKTDTPGLRGRDDAFSMAANYSSPKWMVDANYTEVGEAFNPEMGFLARTEYRKARFGVYRSIRSENFRRVHELHPHVVVTGYWKFDGFQESGIVHLHLPVILRSSTEFDAEVNFTHAGVIEAFDILPGVTIPADTYRHREFEAGYSSDKSRPLRFSLKTTVGGRFGGDRLSLSPAIHYRIGETFRSELSMTYNRFDLPVDNGEFTANLGRLRLSYSFTPKMQLQALVQYNESTDQIGTNIRFSWLSSANSGLYLVYNEVDQRGPGALPGGRELLLKFSHIFDLLN